jgi:predicted Zn-dependent peptidase
MHIIGLPLLGSGLKEFLSHSAAILRDYFKLSNGLDVVLKKRTHTHGTSVRLAVNVGSRNFPCPKREAPHFLEHLLFMGTSRHSEAELKRLIEDHGGAWNAYAAMTETV